MLETRDFCAPGPTSQWDRINENLSIHILNGSMEQGPYTALLHSLPRKKEKMPAQYHSADEELYVLGGTFSFDPGRWFEPGSYAYFPAHFIHGTAVDVSGGYTVYLRIGGAADIFWEDNPTGPGPYLRPGAQSDLKPVQLRRVRPPASVTALEEPAHPAQRPLKQNPVLHDFSTMVSFHHRHVEHSFQMRTNRHLEVFVLSGTFEFGHTFARKGVYGARVAQRPKMLFRCLRPGRLLVSHGGKLTLS